MRFTFGDFELDTEARTLQRRGERVAIQSKAFDLLVYLIEHRERVASVDELLDALWPGVSVTPAALSGAVHKVRDAVEDDGERQAVLLTEHGHGFRFIAEVSVAAAPDAAAPAHTRSAARLAVVVGVAALLVAAAAAWLLKRPVVQSAPVSSVAVLPFANTSQDEATEPFANGIYDDILTHLSKIRDLKVIARTTMERLDPGLSVQEIGTQLGVAAVLEGGVQRAGDRVRINVQLNECESEAHVWAETYDRELTATNIFAIQTEIAESVAIALQARLSPLEQERLAIVPTENLAAYESYLLGRQRMAKGSIRGFVEAIEHYRRAIELDPSFAAAYVGLADSYTMQVYRATAPRSETLAKAQAAADKALALDYESGAAHNSLAAIKGERGDFEGAEAEYLRALELNPNYTDAYHWYATLLSEQVDRPEEALELARKALALDPLSTGIINSFAIILDYLGRFDESLVWLKRLLEVDSSHVLAHHNVAYHYWNVSAQLGRAVEWYLKTIALDPVDSSLPAFLALLYLDIGDPDAAEYWTERSVQLGRADYFPNEALQFLHLYKGEEARALDYARKSRVDFPLGWNAILFLRNHELREGRYAQARALYETTYPELLHDSDPKVGTANWGPTHDLALVLLETGERERAELLLQRNLEYIQAWPRRGQRGLGVADVQILALQGKKREALTALREAIDSGWRRGWWYAFDHEPNLESLRGEPEFQAMREELRADMASQLERLREMEKSEKLAAILPGTNSPSGLAHSP